MLCETTGSGGVRRLLLRSTVGQACETRSSSWSGRSWQRGERPGELELCAFRPRLLRAVVDVSTKLNEQFHELGVAGGTGEHQRRVTELSIGMRGWERKKNRIQFQLSADWER